MKIKQFLLALAGVVALGSGYAIASGVFQGYPAAVSGNITTNNCIPVDVYGPNVADSQGLTPQTVCASPDVLFNYAMPPKPLVGYTTVPVGSVAFATFGNDTTYVNGTTYYAMLDVPVAYEITGISCMNGATVGTDKIIVGLWSNAGALLANSALAGTTTSGADAFQNIAFTAVYNITPGRYYVGVQANGTTDNLKTVAASTFQGVLTASDTGTFGTLETLTVPTTFTANVGPICGIYD